MELSQNEMKMVSYLRFRKAGWPTVKWMCLIGVVVIAVGMILIFRGLWANGYSLLVMIASPLYGGFLAGYVSWLYGQWNGQPHIDLLLRVLDEISKFQAPSPQASQADEEF